MNNLSPQQGKQYKMTKIAIIPFDPIFQKNFISLSLEWINEYNLLEQADEIVLNNPQETILDKGGYIFMAKYGDAIIGTASLEKINEKTYEILKLGVTKNFQKIGIGKLLMLHCIEIAQKNKAEKLLLHSNKKLKEAITLYKKLGFYEIPISDNKFITSDIMMELIL
jgi:ribosomal protein S18 acetylase RimI-like enzyme